jgi:hypothetical protein
MNAIEEIEEQLRRSVAALNPSSSAAPTKPRRRERSAFARRMATRLPVTFATATVAAAVVLAVSLLSSGTTVGPPSAVAAVLRHLAQIAARGPSLVPAPGHYLYNDSVSDSPYYSSIKAVRHGTGCLAYAVEHRQLWVAADGSGLLRESTGAATFTSAHDRAVCLRALSKSTRSAGTSNMWFADQCFHLGPTDDMAALSTDPRTLLRQMRRIDGGPRTAAEDFVHIGDFLRETDASPALRAALYRAAALIPGVKLLGSVRAHDGRLGLGVAYSEGGVRSELIFNPRTAALIGEQSTGNRPGSWTVYLRSRVVGSVPYPSPRPLTPACRGGQGRSRTVPGGVVVTGQGIS